jgi:hypothetical protein
MSTAPTKKRSAAPIARPTEARPLVGERAAPLPAYVAVLRAWKLALVLAPIGVAAACGGAPTRYAGAPPAVQPEPSTSVSTTTTASPPPSAPPPIAPSTTPPPAAGGLRPTSPID